MSKTNSVLLGALKPVHFSHEMHKNALMTHLLSHNYLTEGDCIGDIAHECRSLNFTTMTGGIVYRVGENVVAGEHGDVLNITQFLTTAINGEHLIFVVGDLFQPVMHGSDRVVDQWSKGTLLSPSGIERKENLGA